MQLAEKLVYLRKEKGLSQLQLAELMNVSRQAISRWETGAAVPSAENLKYLGNLYDVSLDYLFNENEDDLKRNKWTMDEIGEKPASVPDSVDTGKNSGRKFIKWAVIALALFGLIVAVYMFVVVRNECDSVPINDIPKKEVESKTEIGFDVAW